MSPIKIQQEIELKRTDILNTALENPAEADWDDYLSTWCVEPLSKQERTELRQKGAQLKTNIVPVELRSVLTVLKDSYLDVIEQLETKFWGSDDISHQYYRLRQYVDDDMVPKTMNQFIERVKPKIMMNSIFQNAQLSQNKYSNQLNASKNYSIKCSCCGAARLETDQYDECFYCGNPIFQDAKK